MKRLTQKQLTRNQIQLAVRNALEREPLDSDVITVYCKGKRVIHGSGRVRTVTRFSHDWYRWQDSVYCLWIHSDAEELIPAELLDKLKKSNPSTRPLSSDEMRNLLGYVVGTTLEPAYWVPVEPPQKSPKRAFGQEMARRAGLSSELNRFFLDHKVFQCPECKQFYFFDFVGLSPFFDSLLQQGQRKISAERLAEMETVPPLDYMGMIPRGEYKLPTLAEMVKDMPDEVRQRVLDWTHKQNK
ncbi:MAG: hypothetical protein E6167_02495 [Varibaculum cambriense]|nr:hypothetical protein [Varibaculum cambriense]MDU5307728.1 hypothetical protein [Varibaculum cambriense]